MPNPLDGMTRAPGAVTVHTIHTVATDAADAGAPSGAAAKGGPAARGPIVAFQDGAERVGLHSPATGGRPAPNIPTAGAFEAPTSGLAAARAKTCRALDELCVQHDQHPDRARAQANYALVDQWLSSFPMPSVPIT